MGTVAPWRVVVCHIMNVVSSWERDCALFVDSLQQYQPCWWGLDELEKNDSTEDLDYFIIAYIELFVQWARAFVILSLTKNPLLAVRLAIHHDFLADEIPEKCGKHILSGYPFWAQRYRDEHCLSPYRLLNKKSNKMIKQLIILRVAQSPLSEQPKKIIDVISVRTTFGSFWLQNEQR